MLASDATIEHVLNTLYDKEDYLCNVLSCMWPCKKTHGTALVSIGTSGSGLRPYFRIFYFDEDELRVFNTYFDNGRSFETEGRKIEGGTVWSSAVMSLEQVQVLLGRIRGRT